MSSHVFFAPKPDDSAAELRDLIYERRLVGILTESDFVRLMADGN